MLGGSTVALLVGSVVAGRVIGAFVLPAFLAEQFPGPGPGHRARPGLRHRQRGDRRNRAAAGDRPVPGDPGCGRPATWRCWAVGALVAVIRSPETRTVSARDRSSWSQPLSTGPADRRGSPSGAAGLCHPGLVTRHGWTDESDVSPAERFAQCRGSPELSASGRVHPDQAVHPRSVPGRRLPRAGGRATACWSAHRPAPARPWSASSPCTRRWPPAASVSTPPRSRRCRTRSSPT